MSETTSIAAGRENTHRVPRVDRPRGTRRLHRGRRHGRHGHGPGVQQGHRQGGRQGRRDHRQGPADRSRRPTRRGTASVRHPRRPQGRRRTDRPGAGGRNRAGRRPAIQVRRRRGHHQVLVADAGRSPEQAPAEAAVDPRAEQATQAAIDHLVAKVLEAAERDGRTVEEFAQSALARLAEGGSESVGNSDGHTTATHEGAKIIAFRPRRVPA